MGKNTPTRQEFIIDNLRIELDVVEEKEEKEEVVAEWLAEFCCWITDHRDTESQKNY